MLPNGVNLYPTYNFLLLLIFQKQPKKSITLQDIKSIIIPPNLKQNHMKQQAPEGDHLPEKNFTKLADTFKLTAELTPDSLTIYLQDYTDWVVYKRHYTDEDIGKQIHKKAELSDLYFSLSQLSDSDENKMMERERDMEMEKARPNKFAYKFGDIVKVQGIPCYKIQKQGKLTVFVNIFDRLSKKQIAYDSNLKLTKKRTLSQIQILIIKYEQEKNVDQKGSCLHMKQLKTENLLQLLHKQEILIFETNNKLEQKQNQLQATTKKLQRVQKQLQEAKQKQQIIIQQLQQTHISLEQLQQKQDQHKNDSWLDVAKCFEIGNSQANIGRFLISSNMIEYITTTDTKKTHYLLHSFIPYGKNFVFKVKLVRYPRGEIAFGVVDFKAARGQRSSLTSNFDSVFYQSNANTKSGKICSQNKSIKEEALFFRQGQIIRVDVNLQEGSISWSQGTQTVSTKYEKLQQSSTIFVPSIQFYNVHDIVQLIELLLAILQFSQLQIDLIIYL